MDQNIDAICGDLDSAQQAVQEYYKYKGADIVHDEDQYSTDLWKAMTHMYALHTTVPEHPIDVAIFGGLEGRADQALSQLHQLYSIRTSRPPRAGKVYLITSTSIIFLLETGFNRIHTPVSEDRFTENAGIVPLVSTLMGYSHFQDATIRRAFEMSPTLCYLAVVMLVAFLQTFHKE